MKRTVALLLAIVALAGGVLACGAEPTATPAPTPTAGPTPTPLPLQAPGWEDVTVRTVCLEVEQSFPEVPPELEEVATPHVSEVARHTLGGLGMRVVEGPCEATLAISMTGQALAAEYLGAGRCYEGAEVNSEMRFAVSGRAPFTSTIVLTRPTPSMVPSEYCSKQPFEAPFSQIWPQALLEGLAQLWGPQATIAALRNEEWFVRSAALEVLAQIGPEEEVAPVLIHILESDELYLVRADAAMALGRLGAAEGVVPALLRALEDEDEDASVRLSATVALGMIGPETTEVIPALLQALGDEDFMIREAAVGALGMIGPEVAEVMPALIQALEDDWPFVREAAAEALGQIGPEAAEAVPNLIEALEDERPFVRKAAAEALAAITGQDLGEDAAAWQEWWEGQ